MRFACLPLQNMTMTWTQHSLSEASSDSTCKPWLLSLSGDVAQPQKQSRKKHKRRLAAVDSAISLFLYASAAEGELYQRNGTRGADGEPLLLISGYRRTQASGAGNEHDSDNGFGMLAWASHVEHSSSAAASGAAADASPSGAAPAGAAAKRPAALVGRTHYDSDGSHLASPGGPLPSAARLQQAWHASGTRLPAEDAWKVEDILRRSLDRSAAVAASAAAAGRAAARQARKRDLEAAAAAAAAAGNPTPASVPASAEERALQAALDVPVVPALGAAGTAPQHGNNVIAAQLVLTPPFRLQVLFMQQGCFAASGASAAPGAAGSGDDDAAAFSAAASSPVRRITADTWLRLGQSLGLAGPDGGVALATERRRQYYADLCSRLNICVADELVDDGAAAGEVSGADSINASAAVVVASKPPAPVVAARAVANLVGSITYFYGRQLVAPGPYPLDGDTSASLRGARESEPQHLFTGVPSRSFFPRGFLWDEGFHQLILSQVNAPLSMRVLASWLASMDDEGWIAREQILGGEARSRVPERFRVQHRDIANPPALLLPFLAIASDTLCKPHILAGSRAGGGAAAVSVGADGQMDASAGAGAPATSLPPFVSAGTRAFCAARLPTPSVQGKECRYACVELVGDGAALPSAADVLSAPLLPSSASDGDADDILHFLQEAVDDASSSSGSASALAASGTAPVPHMPSAAAQRHTLAFMRAAYPLLARHYGWLRRTQAGAEPGSFRWRGASADHNFASGLDDYPRGVVPTLADENVDLLSWVAFFARALEQLSVLVEAPASETARWRADAAAAEQRIVDVHWDEAAGLFCDVAAQSLRASKGKHPHRAPPTPVMGRDCHQGYVSLLPLMLRLLPTGSGGSSSVAVDAADQAAAAAVNGSWKRIAALLDAIEDPRRLWTPRGLRSLSAASPLYRSKEDYWRGAIWINMNYLAVGALRHYGQAARGDSGAAAGAASDGGAGSGGSAVDVAARAAAASERLASALVDGVVAEYQRSGFIWENYDPNTGKGRGTHPFTGWSALVALLLARRFPV